MKWFWRILDTATEKGVQKWRHVLSCTECLYPFAITVSNVRKLKKWKIEILIAIMKENMFWWRKIMWNFFLSFFRKYFGKIFLKNIFLRPIHYENMTISDNILHIWRLEGYRKNTKKYDRACNKSIQKIKKKHKKSKIKISFFVLLHKKPVSAI